jgi:hypothetical protein
MLEEPILAYENLPASIKKEIEVVFSFDDFSRYWDFGEASWLGKLLQLGGVICERMAVPKPLQRAFFSVYFHHNVNETRPVVAGLAKTLYNARWDEIEPYHYFDLAIMRQGKPFILIEVGRTHPGKVRWGLEISSVSQVWVMPYTTWGETFWTFRRTIKWRRVEKEQRLERLNRLRQRKPDW